MLRSELESALREMAVDIDRRQMDALEKHARMLLDANRVVNLTRITDERDLVRLHVADSLTALPYVAGAPPGALADIGSGGGYPGIPLAIMSGRPTTLIESTSKKAAFLETVIVALGLEAEVVPSRAEEAGRTHGGRFAVVTARAVAPLAALVELASPLLSRSGLFIALKGVPDAEEVARGDRAAALAGMRREESVTVRLPEGDERRTLVCYRRTGKPRVALPRRPGMAQHDPLG